MTTTPQGALADAEAALSSALGDGAVITAPERARRLRGGHVLAGAARDGRGDAAGAPGVVVRPRTEEDVADGAGDRRRAPRAGGAVGRRLGHAGRRAAHPRRHRRSTCARSTEVDRDRRGLDDRHRAGRQERARARGRAQRPRADAAALPGVGRVGDGRRLHRRARLGRALDPLRQDRGPRAVAARGDAGRRADATRSRVPRHAVGPGADAAVRRLRGHARRDHAGDAAARAAARRAPLRRRRVPDRRAPASARSGARCRPATARRWCACTTRRRRG